MTLAIAHRGDPRGFPENTLASLRSAEALGADIIEIDVRLTAEGEIILLHDHTFERIWGVRKAPTEMTLGEIRDLRAAGERIPTLEEALAAVQVPVLVDFTEEEEGYALGQALRAYSAERVLVCSGNIAGLRHIRAASPHVPVALTWTHSTFPPDALLEQLQPRYLNPYFQLVQPDWITGAHARGIRVSAWTVDLIPQMRALVELGADAITTNEIAALRRTLDGT